MILVTCSQHFQASNNSSLKYVAKTFVVTEDCIENEMTCLAEKLHYKIRRLCGLNDYLNYDKPAAKLFENASSVVEVEVTLRMTVSLGVRDPRPILLSP
jgi:hypothetical protein